MSDKRDILERLRSAANSNELRHEAADEIDDLTKANQILQALIGNRDKEVDRLRAQLEGCKEMFAHTAERANEYVKAFQQQEGKLASARKALDRMSEQRTSSEMDEDQHEHADWQGGYDAMVVAARAANSALTDEERKVAMRGHTKSGINDRRPLTDNTRSVLRSLVDRRMFHSDLDQSEANAMKALLTRGYADWHIEDRSYSATGAGRVAVASAYREEK